MAGTHLLYLENLAMSSRLYSGQIMPNRKFNKVELNKPVLMQRDRVERDEGWPIGGVVEQTRGTTTGLGACGAMITKTNLKFEILGVKAMERRHYKKTPLTPQLCDHYHATSYATL